MIHHHSGRGIRDATKGKRPTNIIDNIDADLKRQRAVEQKNLWRSELKKKANVQLGK